MIYIEIELWTRDASAKQCDKHGDDHPKEKLFSLVVSLLNIAFSTMKEDGNM